MYIDPSTNHHYYVGEISQLKDGMFVVPIKWFLRKGDLVASAHPIMSTDVGSFCLSLNYAADIQYSDFPN